MLDDLFADTYGWKSFDEKKKNMLDLLRRIQPGVTQIIIHPTLPSENFKYISESGDTRLADLAMGTFGRERAQEITALLHTAFLDAALGVRLAIGYTAAALSAP